MLRFLVFAVCLLAGFFAQIDFAIWISLIVILGVLLFWLPILLESKVGPAQNDNPNRQTPHTPNDE